MGANPPAHLPRVMRKIAPELRLTYLLNGVHGTILHPIRMLNGFGAPGEGSRWNWSGYDPLPG